MKKKQKLTFVASLYSLQLIAQNNFKFVTVTEIRFVTLTLNCLEKAV